ncbi:uncharacterized protein LOC133782066 [Humulus lupulus]|uniref:uncharacterized protein LOC133782066 n=1 Tax=Humulus lupulus TaxID=3486 RepID=UPI002B4052E1|nr:uncharacterized protein LOC133782066 [Humulus lupulus]XP_062077213.1 uncharacterized protein LOC133782066 [Humulus lupulus]
MENFHGGNNYTKPSRIKIPPGMKAQQLMIVKGGRYQTNTISPSFDLIADDPDHKSSIIRYLRSGSPIAGNLVLAEEQVIDATKICHPYPHYCGNGGSGHSGFVSRGFGPSSVLSPMKNMMDRSPPVYRTPVKAVEGEEVLVMDGVPVSGGVGRSSRSVADSSSSGKSQYKTENFHSREDSGNSRYSSKIQVAHGKENLRPTRLVTKNKTETPVSSKPNNSPGQSSCSPNSCFPLQVMTPTRSASPATSRGTTSSDMASRDWCPLDDGLIVTLPHSSSTEKSPSRGVNAYINGVLYGPARKRLPVFSGFRSD